MENKVYVYKILISALYLYSKRVNLEMKNNSYYCQLYLSASKSKAKTNSS